MFSDGSSFYKRAILFYRELKQRSFPNASSLSRIAQCSKNTAQRTIDRLRDEHLMPVAYDESRHGYLLSNPDYEMPVLPPGKDEMIALLLARDLSGTLDAEDLCEKIDSLWRQYEAQNPRVTAELRDVMQCFSSDMTVVGRLADCGLLEFLDAAAKRVGVALRYKSPWSEHAEAQYRGRITRVHFSDGILYLQFVREDGRTLVFNASFIRELERLASDPSAGKEPDSSWLEGFGVWAKGAVQQIEVRIAQPAAGYYAAQSWHESQEDAWEGDVLVRRFRAVVSPEVARRVLSLGSFVRGVKPQELGKMVLAEAQGLSVGVMGGGE